MFDNRIKLIKTVTAQDENSYDIEKEVGEKTVFCEIKSVGRAEFYAAGQSGMKADAVITVHADEYSGETLIETLDFSLNVRFRVGRSFKTGRDIELTCSQV